MRSAFFYVLGLSSGIAMSIVYTLANEAAMTRWRKLMKTNKPLFSGGTGRIARIALTQAEDIFQQADNNAGTLGYPWKIRGTKVDEEDVQSDLRAASAAIKDADFRDSVEIVKTELANVKQAKPPKMAIYIPISGYIRPESEEDRRARKRADKIEELQRVAAERGLSAAKDALLKLDELSLNG